LPVVDGERNERPSEDAVADVTSLVAAAGQLVAELEVLSEQLLREASTEGPGPAEVAAAVQEMERRAAVFDVLLPHFLEEGVRPSWSDVFDSLSEEEWTKLALLLDGRDLAEVLLPRPAPSEKAPVRRWQGGGWEHIDGRFLDRLPLTGPGA
jgi:hypothetical protein